MGNVSSSPPGEQATALLDFALADARRGWHVLPCRPHSKKPAQKAWPRVATCDPVQVERWWALEPAYNVGVQLGPRSGIIDVECDSPDAERELGALLRDDASVVPTFQAKRGKHRLFCYQADLPCPEKGVFKFRGIEFRTGNGNKGIQSLFPPSVHPDGAVYTWLVHPDDADPVPFPAAALAIVRAAMDAPAPPCSLTQATLSRPKQTQQTQANPLHVLTALGDRANRAAIAATLPAGPGERNRRLFDLARLLKGLVPDATSGKLREIVRMWWTQALPFIRTKDFDESWADFAVAWERVKRPAGQSFRAAAAGVEDRLPAVADRYDGDLRRLVGLCWGLQSQWQDRPFPLSCRKAGEYLHSSHVHAWKLLKALQFDGVLRLVKKGTKASGKASEWRFVDPEHSGTHQ